MCGFLFTSDPSISQEMFLSSLALMEHRGPDSPSNYFSSKNFKLGHHRLKILDLKPRSNQPFWSKDKRFCIIFNGEIYNYKELIQDLNISVNTNSDTEVLLELFIRYRMQMLKWLNGMFAFVILDTEENNFFVARDRLGIKPLYFIQRENKFYTFSSEISSIVNLYNCFDIDPIGIRQYRKLRAFFNGHTLYQGISMFPAGHFLLNGKMTQYWEFPDIEQSWPDDEEISFLVNSSVSYRCISDVSVGSFLSGGLDSTIVAQLAGQLHTWTVGFPEYNEFYWAKIAAQKLHSIHHQVEINSDTYIQHLHFMVNKRQEPLSVPNEVLLYHMVKEVKKFNTVILSGEGADELFFGYDRVFRWAASCRQWDLKKFSELYSYGSNDDLEIVESVISPFFHYGEPISIVAAFFQVAHLHGLLRRLDNATMLCSVEARVPFVDHRLIERMAGVPFKYRINGDQVKAPLKRIYRDVLPVEVINRPKVGFPIPLEKVMKDSIRGESLFDKWLQKNLDILNIKS